MTEVTKYIADDGTEFDTALECRKYEDAFTNPEMKNITFITSDHKEVEFNPDGDFFENIDKIIIHNEDEYAEFEAVTNSHGWYFEEIDQPGTWIWANGLDSFIRVDDILNDYVGQLKWERDMAMEMLDDIGIPFGHKYKDITDKMGMNSNGINLIAKLLNEGNARVIQIGGWDK